jgi:hypothetical protein
MGNDRAFDSAGCQWRAVPKDLPPAFERREHHKEIEITVVASAKIGDAIGEADDAVLLRVKAWVPMVSFQRPRPILFRHP